MQQIYCLLFILLASTGGAFGQKRSVTVFHNNTIYNYSITRYVPVWEVQSGKDGKEGLLSQQKQFFKQATNGGLSSLKDLFYSKALVPENVKQMDSKAMESHLASNSLVIYYRVQYKDHSIFLAHLGNRTVRSVIPFRVDGGKWILDASFSETEFYKLLSSRDFDPYMGIRDGQVVCAFGFEEVAEMKHIYDYSGYQHHLKLNNVSIGDGRFGGALRLSGGVVGTAVLNNLPTSNGTFSIDVHMNIANMVYNTEKKRSVLSLVGANTQGMLLQLVGTKMRLTYPTAGGSHNLEWSYVADKWFHLDIESNPSGVAVKLDGIIEVSSAVPTSIGLQKSTLTIGAQEGAKGMLDEFRITD